MKAKSIKGKNTVEIKDALEKSMADGFKPTLAVVFISEENERDAVCQILSDKGVRIFGASAGNEFIDGDFENISIAILLLEMNPAYFQVQLLHANEPSKISIAEQIGNSGKKIFSSPAFLIVSGGLITDGDEIVAGIENTAGKGVNLFGGLAADNMKMEKTYVFTNDELTDNGLLALILDEDRINLTGLAVGGWNPIGNEKTITQSKGNIVYTIDDEPAFDFITRYSGIKKTDLEKGVAIAISSNFQLQLQRENKHPVMRTPMYVNKEDGSIVFAGSLPQGSKVRLSMLPGFEVIEASLNEFAQCKNKQLDAEALIMFSCAGRQIALGPYVSEEINGIKKIWDVPMAGFFCFGEIGRVANDKIEFHNMTCSLAILKEKRN